VEAAAAGSKAVVCRRGDFGQYSALLAGFGQRMGTRETSGPVSRPLLLRRQESSVRLMSPSRTLSARLADREARMLDRRDRKLVA
jgi:hypothetical protein